MQTRACIQLYISCLHFLWPLSCNTGGYGIPPPRYFCEYVILRLSRTEHIREAEESVGREYAQHTARSVKAGVARCLMLPCLR